MSHIVRPRSHVKRPEIIHKAPLENVPLASLATVTTYTVNVPYGFYHISISAHTDGNTDGSVVLKLKPFVDDNQTVVGRALYAYPLGSSTLTTALTIASSNSTNGDVWDVVPDAGSTGVRVGTPRTLHSQDGFQLTVDINTNATTSAEVGNLTVRVHAEN